MGGGVNSNDAIYGKIVIFSRKGGMELGFFDSESLSEVLERARWRTKRLGDAWEIWRNGVKIAYSQPKRHDEIEEEYGVY